MAPNVRQTRRCGCSYTIPALFAQFDKDETIENLNERLQHLEWHLLYEPPAGGTPVGGKAPPVDLSEVHP